MVGVVFKLLMNHESYKQFDQMFVDVKYVCFGGTPQRMKAFAQYMLKTVSYNLPTGTCLTGIYPLIRHSCISIE